MAAVVAARRSRPTFSTKHHARIQANRKRHDVRTNNPAFHTNTLCVCEGETAQHTEARSTQHSARSTQHATYHIQEECRILLSDPS